MASGATGTSVLDVEIRFASDWHVGEGAGRPRFIDKLVRRDPRDRLPYVPAKSWVGIWRDACERIARGLDGADTGPWQELLVHVFGSQPGRREERRHAHLAPCAARLQPRPARLEAKLRRWLQQPAGHAFGGALTYVKPGVKIDRVSKVAMDKHLHMDEVVRGGLALEARVSVECDDLAPDAVAAVLALLWAGTKAVERIGGKRRRGLGRCSFHVAALDAAAKSHLAALRAVAPKVPPKPLDVTRNATVHQGTSGDLIAVPLRLELHHPVVIPLRTIGNVVYTRDFVPGGFLLPALSGCLARILGVRLEPLVAKGDVRILNAYPEVDGARGRPTPLALFHGKDAPAAPLWNRLVEDEPAGVQLKQSRSGYVGAFPVQQQALPAVDDTERWTIQATHNTIDDEFQRPTAAVGGVYTYQAIGAGRVLRTELQLRADLVRELDARDPEWRQRLQMQTRIGLSKKDDYGLVEISLVPAAVSPDGIATPNASLPVSSPVVVWLLSDVLVRNQSTGTIPGVEALLAALNTRLPAAQFTLRSPGPGEPVFARGNRTDGWLRRWDLPRPSHIGIAAGSCFALNVGGSVTRGQLDALAREGIGERRAEGFGEIVAGDPLVTSPLSGLAPCAPNVPTSTENVPTGRPDARAEVMASLQAEVWSRSIDRLSVALGGRQTFRRDQLRWTKKRPGNSQLGALRSAVLQRGSGDSAPRDGGFAPLHGWIHDIENGSRRDRWPAGALGVLQSLANDPCPVWEWLEWEVRNSVGRIGEDHADDRFEAVLAANLPLLDGQSRIEAQSLFAAIAARRVLLAAIRAEARNREDDANPDPKELNDGTSVD